MASLGTETLVNSAAEAPPGDGDAAATLTSTLEPSLPGNSGDNGADGLGRHPYGRDEKHIDNTISVMDDRSQVLSKIKKLQDELLKIEAGAREEQMLERVENRWEKELERVGGDAEQQSWARFQEMKAQNFIKDTAAFAFSREWVHEREDSFIREMIEREEFDKQLVRRRMRWESKNGITQPKSDDQLKPSLPTSVPSFRFPITSLIDPLSDEARFNATPGAQGYDAQERTLRNQIHEIVISKHNLFMQWKRSLQHVPPAPTAPDGKLENIWPKPNINYVLWPSFRYDSPGVAFLSERKQHLFAVDVLDGEPDINMTRATRINWDDGSKIPIAIPESAQGLVPERIRLNGPQFTNTFRDLDLEGFGFLTYAPAQMVLLQPYRPLVYHEKAIRDRYEELKEKFGTPGEDETASRTGPTQASEHPDATHGDDEHEARKGSSEGVEKSQSSEEDTEPGHQKGAATEAGESEGPQQETKENPDETEFPLAHSKTAMDYLGCLLEFYDATVSIRRKYIQGAECRKIQFRDLWYLFNPGDEVVRRDGRQVYRVIEVVNPTHRASSRNFFFDFDDRDSSTYFQVVCVYVDFDGKKIGPVSTTFVIKTFAGERTVESLEIYPLRLHRNAPAIVNQNRKYRSVSSNSQGLRQDLIKRGRKFLQAACMKLENTFYSGPTAEGEEVESQVVIDFDTALSSDRNFDEESIPLIKSMLADADDDSSSSTSDDGPSCSGWCCEGDFVCDDSTVDSKRKADYIDSLIPKTYSKLPSVAIYPRNLDDTTGDNALTDDEFLLMTYRVFAFVLRTRKWGELYFFPTPSGSCCPSNRRIRRIKFGIIANRCHWLRIYRKHPMFL